MKKFNADTKVVQIIVPRDGAGGAAVGDWVSMENYDSCMFIYSSDAGTAGQDVEVQVRQATANDGSGAKDVDKSQWYVEQHATALTDSFSADGTADTGLFEDDGETICIARIEITADQLDIAGGFEWVTLSVTDSGATAGKLQSAVAVLRGARYGVAVPDQPTALS